MLTTHVDLLSKTSRDFYERSKLKLVYSVAFGGGALLLLAACSSFGGLSLSAKDLETDHDDGSQTALSGGFGRFHLYVDALHFIYIT